MKQFLWKRLTEAIVFADDHTSSTTVELGFHYIAANQEGADAVQRAENHNSSPNAFNSVGWMDMLKAHSVYLLIRIPT